MTATQASAPGRPLDQALAAADAAERRLSELKTRAASERAKLADPGTLADLTPADVRALADQVQHLTPAAIELAEIDAARAQIVVLDARKVIAQASIEPLTAERDRLQGIAREASAAANAAASAVVWAFQDVGQVYERTEAANRLTEAIAAAERNRHQRLSTLTGQTTAGAEHGQGEATSEPSGSSHGDLGVVELLQSYETPAGLDDGPEAA